MSVVKLVRVATVAVALLLGVTVVAVMMSGNGNSPSTGTPSTTIAPVAKLSTSNATQNGPATTLPPSRDNDAGRARNKDITPDADADAYQSVIP